MFIENVIWKMVAILSLPQCVQPSSNMILLTLIQIFCQDKAKKMYKKSAEMSIALKKSNRDQSYYGTESINPSSVISIISMGQKLCYYCAYRWPSRELPGWYNVDQNIFLPWNIWYIFTQHFLWPFMIWIFFPLISLFSKRSGKTVQEIMTTLRVVKIKKK